MSFLKKESISEESLQNGKILVDMYGGKDNIEATDCCYTRLRITVKDISKINQEKLTEFGGKAIVIFGNSTQVVFGEKTEEFKKDVDNYLKSK